MTRVGGSGFSSLVMALATAFVGASCGSIAPSPPASPAASGAPSSPAPTWQRLDVGEATYLGTVEVPFVSVNAGVAYGSGFVLVGTSQDQTGEARGGVWSTPDGTAWTRVADEDNTFEEMYLAHVATDGRRLLALGRSSRGVDGRPAPSLAWVSDDGAHWERHEVEATPLGRIDAGGIVGSPSGFVAWGARADGHNELLHSVDGVAWQTIDYPGAADSDISSVAPYGAGFLAVGAEHNEGALIGGPSPAARAWWSPDGQRWTSAPVPGGWALHGVYPAAAGVFAVGAHECSRCVGPPLAWHSTDGQGWSLLGDQEGHGSFVGSNGAQIASFAWQDDRSIALSGDGRNWRKLAANLPVAEHDAGMIVGSDGVLLLIAKTPRVDGVEYVNSGALFLRGS